MSTMQPFDTPTLERLAQLCKEHAVAELYLVGSAATGQFDPATSDYDFLVRFRPGGKADARGFDDVYFRLLRDLRDLLGRRVDLIEVGSVTNTFVRRELERTKVPLYAAA